MTRNQKAFLSMLAWAEGTDNGRQPTTNRGYDVLVGGSLFTDFTDHPRRLVRLRPGLASTAAGRYQLLARYFDFYRRLLKLPDFSPESQDAIALQQIRERGAIPDIEAGNFAHAVNRVRNIWASLPGAGYGQHEQKLADLERVYRLAGGEVE